MSSFYKLSDFQYGIKESWSKERKVRVEKNLKVEDECWPIVKLEERFNVANSDRGTKNKD